MHRAHCKPKVIVDALQRGEEEKPFLRRPIYNYTYRMKSKDRQGKNPAMHFLQLAKERDYLVRFELEPDTDQLKDMFWSHPTARKMLRCYKNVFCIDATYSTNKYNYALVEIIGVAPTNQNFTAAQALLQHEDKASYLWVMECFAELLGDGVYPKSIITDRELGLFEPIATIFPESRHVLCMYHVKKMIRARAVIVMKTEKEADALCNGAVARVLEAPTVLEYIENEALLRARFGWVPGFMKYMDETWLVHKEKIVFAWTNQVMHYGNNTTNRVESAHSALKDWMRSCRGGLDTLFDETYAEVEGQAKEIRCKLEWSRTKNLHGFDSHPYKLLLRRVSHHCLKVLKAEFLKLGRCTHALPTTHGLPCRCQMEYLFGSQDFIIPCEVDSFWTTLVYDGEDTEVPECPYDMSRFLRDYQERDPADQFRMARMFHEVLYPEEGAYEEPARKETKKGRPSKKKAKTSRELSYWEHVDKKYCTSQSSRASSNGTSVDNPDIEGSWDVPEFVRHYLVSVDNVEGDGNCGFRCAALKFLGSEEHHVTVRNMMVAEINAHRDIYEGIYKKNREDDLDRAIRRIYWNGGRCTSAHWMETPCDLFALAQVFRAVASIYTVDRTGRQGCCTVFPWRGKRGEYQNLLEFSIIYRSKQLHYVLGHFGQDDSEPDHPLPTLHPMWKGIRDRSLRVWVDREYAERLNRFVNLQNIHNSRSESQNVGNCRRTSVVDLSDS